MTRKRSYITIAEAARLLGVSENRVRRMINSGELCAVRYGKQWRIAIDDVNKKKEELG